MRTVLLLMLISIVLPVLGQYATESLDIQEEKGAGNCASIDTGGTSWTNAWAAAGGRGVNWADMNTEEVTDALRCTNFGHSSVLLNTVHGYEMIWRMRARRGATFDRCDMYIDGSTSGNYKSGNGDADVCWRNCFYEFSFGGPYDSPWGTSISPVETTYTNYGVQCEFKDKVGGGGDDNDMDVEVEAVLSVVHRTISISYDDFQPRSGSAGQEVTLTGNNFDAFTFDTNFEVVSVTDNVVLPWTRTSNSDIRFTMPSRYPYQSDALALGHRRAGDGAVINSGISFTYPAMPTTTTVTDMTNKRLSRDRDGSNLIVNIALSGSVPTGPNVYAALIPIWQSCLAVQPSLRFQLSAANFNLDLSTPDLIWRGDLNLCLSTRGPEPVMFVAQQGFFLRMATSYDEVVTSMWPKVIGVNTSPELQLSFISDYAAPNTRIGIGTVGCPHSSVTRIMPYTTPGATLTLPNESGTIADGRLCLSTDGNFWDEQTLVGQVRIVAEGISGVVPSVWGGGTTPIVNFGNAQATDAGTYHGFVPQAGSCTSTGSIVASTPLGSALSSAITPTTPGDDVYRVCQSQDGGASYVDTGFTVTVTSAVSPTVSFNSATQRITTEAVYPVTLDGLTPTDTTYARIVRYNGGSPACGSLIVEEALMDSSNVIQVFVPSDDPSLAGYRRIYYAVCISTTGRNGPYTYQVSPTFDETLEIRTMVFSNQVSAITPGVIGEDASSPVVYRTVPIVPGSATGDINLGVYTEARLALAIPGGCSSPSLRLWTSPTNLPITGTTVTGLDIPDTYAPPSVELTWCLQITSLVDFIELNPSVTVAIASPYVVTSVVPSTILAGLPVTLTADGAVGSTTTRIALGEPGCGTLYLDTPWLESDTGGSKILDGGATLGNPTPVPSSDVLSVCYSVNSGNTWVEQELVSISYTNDTSANTVISVSPDSIPADFVAIGLVLESGTPPPPESRVTFAAAGKCATGPRFGGSNGFGGSSPSPPAPLVSAIPSGGRYVTCYSLTPSVPSSWTEQVSPETSLVVIEATATSIKSLSSQIWGAGNSPTITLTRGVTMPDLRCSLCSVAFIPQGQPCAELAVVGETTLPTSGSLTVSITSISPGGTHDVCYTSSGSSGYVKQVEAGTVQIIDATATSISGIFPDVIGDVTMPALALTGAIGSSSTYVAFSSVPNDCSGTLVGEGALGLGEAGAWTLPAMLSEGTYTVCYSVTGPSPTGVFVAQTLVSLEVLTAAADSLTSFSPTVVGSGAANTFDLVGIVPSVMTAVAFVETGTGCTSGARVGILEVDSTLTGVPVIDPIVSLAASNPDYDVCYTVSYGQDGETWVRQTGAGANTLTVVVPVPNAITSVGPQTLGATTLAVSTPYTVTFGGLVPSDNVYVGFGRGGCTGLIEGLTQYSTPGPTPLGSAIGTTGVYRLCLSTANGNPPFVTQSTSVTVEVVEVTGSSMSSMVPVSVGTDSVPDFTFDLAFAPTPDAAVAFSTDTSCATGIEGVVDISASAGPHNWVTPLSVTSPTSYTVCATVDGTNYVAQSLVSLDVAVANPTSISTLTPVVFGVGPGGLNNVMVSLAGPLASASAFVGFAGVGGPGCGSPDFYVPYTTSGELDMSTAVGGSFAAGEYLVCYTVTSSTTGYAEQTLVGTVTAVEPTAGHVVDALPSYSVVGMLVASVGFRMNGPPESYPFATTVFGVDASGTCSSVEGTTVLSDLAEAPANVLAFESHWWVGERGASVSSVGSMGSLCLSFDAGSTFVPVGGVHPVVPLASPPASGLVSVQPDGIQAGDASPVLLRGVAVGSSPTARVAFVLSSVSGGSSDCSDGAARLSEINLQETVFTVVDVTVPAAGRYDVCVSHDGTNYARQNVSISSVDCTTRTSCSSCLGIPECGWCAGTSTCSLSSLVADTCPGTQSVCPTTASGSCFLDTCPAITAMSPTNGVVSGGTVLELTVPVAVNAPGLECRFVLDGTVVEAYTPAISTSPTTIECAAAPSDLGILGASVSLFQAEAGTGNRVPYGDPNSFSSLSYYLCNVPELSRCGACASSEDRPECGFCLLAGSCLSGVQCDAAIGFNATAAEVGAGPAQISPIWIREGGAFEACPTVSSIVPLQGRTDGVGAELTITGTMFVNDTGALVGGGGIGGGGGDGGVRRRRKSRVSTRAAPGDFPIQYQCGFGSLETATNATVVSSTQAVCDVPVSASDGPADFTLFLNGKPVADFPSAFTYALPPIPPPPPPDHTTRNILGALAIVLFLAICAGLIVGALFLKRKRDMDKLLEPPAMSRAEIDATIFGTPISMGVDGKEVLALISRFVYEFVLDYEFISLLADVTPATEVDRVAKAAVIVYEATGHSLDLLLYQVSREVTNALTLQTLFRTNSMATKMFKLYSKLKGLDYVRGTLGRPINKIMLEDDVDVDGLKSGKAEGAQFQLLKLSQTLFNAVRASVPSVPAEFRYLFRAVQSAIQEKFPVRADELAPLMADALRDGLEETSTLYASGAETFAHLSTISSDVSGDTMDLARILEPVHDDLVAYENSVQDLAARLEEMSELVEKLSGATDPHSPAARRLLADMQASANSVGVGGFFFLRFLVPAITAPESYGLVHENPDLGQRKLLVLLGKVIQNLSNQKEFGSKESYMKSMNSMITSNAETISSLLDDLAKVPVNAAAKEDLEFVDVPSKYIDGSLVFLYKHAATMKDKILAKLAEPTLGSVTLPPDVVSQREAARQLFTDIMTDIENARQSGERGSRLDYSVLKRTPFATCMPALGGHLAGWVGE